MLTLGFGILRRWRMDDECELCSPGWRRALGYVAVGEVATIGIDVSQGVTALRATPATDRVSVA